ncbi:MAG: T9SS type A sorting domain-containing protein [Crocinitomicaceae bacterium]|nr:T9SS type A sorting domain-containing protein [Crocinitomicaceae bacterium]
MKQFFTTFLFLTLTAFYGLTQNIQGDGGLPKTFKQTLNTKDLDTWVFETPDVASLLAEDAINDPKGDAPWRFGHNNYTSLNLNNSGSWIETSNGSKIWRVVISCEEALTVNLTFSETLIPNGNELYVYNPEKDFILGSFNENHIYQGELGTELIPGNTVVVEYFVPNGNSLGSVNISTVTHGYRTANEFAEKAFGSSGSCNMNANCPDGASWVNERNSVVMLVSGSSGFCTGALINNTLNDGTPYVLTANHCYSNPTNWIFRFNWQSENCNNPSGQPSFVSLSGATLRSRRTPTDFCLVEITGGLDNGTVPASYSPFFSGWDNTGDIPTSTVCIHHPAGDIKKLAFDDDAASVSQSMGSTEAGSTWTVQWDRNTTTEGGSSGSPLFDQNHRIIGQLWGGGASCQNLNSPDYYGRVSKSWEPTGSNTTNQLKHWLDPNSAGAGFVDGFDPSGASATAYDAGVSGASLEQTAVCGTEFIPSFNLSNPGSQTLTSAVINYNIDGGANQTLNWSGSLAQYQSEGVVLPSVTLSTGNHTLSIEVSLPNNETDENANNDIANDAITIDAFPETAVYVTVSLLTDDYSEETYMEITNSGGAVIWSEGNENVAGNFGTGNANPDADPTNAFENNTAYEWDVPLSSVECYTFTIYDYYGDGIDSEQWNGTNGALELKDNFGGVIYSLDAPNFGGDESSVVKNATVDLTENSNGFLSVYPNPATDFIILQSGKISGSFEITSMSGRVLDFGTIENIKTTIDTKTWSSGTYLVRVVGQNETPEVKRFTIK